MASVQVPPNSGDVPYSLDRWMDDMDVATTREKRAQSGANVGATTREEQDEFKRMILSLLADVSDLKKWRQDVEATGWPGASACEEATTSTKATPAGKDSVDAAVEGFHVQAIVRPSDVEVAVERNPETSESTVSRILGQATHDDHDIACGQNVHAWCIVNASKPGVPCLVSLFFLVLSVGFIVMQICLLSAVILESSFTRCVAHDECSTGEWCSPALAGSFSTTPGVCFDCWSADMFYDATFHNGTYPKYPDPYEDMAKATNDTWFIEGFDHCSKNDELPRRCDHLVASLGGMSKLTLFVIVCTTVLIVAPILNDIDDVEDLGEFAHHRAKSMPNPKHKFVFDVAVWLAGVLRQWVLPMMIVGATLGLMLGSKLTAQSMLMDGIAMTFLTSVDDTMGWVFFDPKRRADERPSLPVPRVLWVFHRVYAFCLIAVLVGTVWHAEALLEKFGNEKPYGAVCSDVREIVTKLSCYTCAFFASLRAPVKFALRFVDGSVQRREEHAKMRFCKAYADLPFLTVENWYWARVFVKLLIDSIVPAMIVFWFQTAFGGQNWFVNLQISDGLEVGGWPGIGWLPEVDFNLW